MGKHNYNTGADWYDAYVDERIKLYPLEQHVMELERKLAAANPVVEAAALVIAMALINHGECDKAGCLFCETYQKYDKLQGGNGDE